MTSYALADPPDQRGAQLPGIVLPDLRYSAMSSKSSCATKARAAARAARHFDPGLLELRAALTALGAVLAAYGASLLIEHAAHQHVDLVITAVVLTATLARTQRGVGTVGRLTALALLAVSALPHRKPDPC